MLPNRCQSALTSATNGVVKPFVRCNIVKGQTHFVKNLAPTLSIYKILNYNKTLILLSKIPYL